MKKQVAGWVLVAFVAVGLSRLVGQSRLAMSPGGTLASCGISATKELALCNVAGDPLAPDGLYVSANGAQPFLVGKITQGSGVQTFNNRTGNVLPAAGDYAYSDLKSPPTKIACTTSSQSNAGFTASGCTIN